jgi:anti-sigma factor RsiW
MTHREMTCPLLSDDSVDVLLDYSAGRLDKARSARLERHMEACDACAAFRVEQSALWSALDEWEPEPVSMDFNRRLWHKIDVQAAAPWYWRLADSLRMGTWKSAIPLAAAALVVAVGFMMDHQGITPLTPGVAGTKGVSITEVDQVEKTLDDVQLLKQFDSTVTEAGASKTM